MQSATDTPVVFCFMVVTYFFLVGAISWVAWNRHDDGIRGLAMALCTSTLGYILVSVSALPEAIAIGGYYCLAGQAHVFMQYGVLKNFRKKMYWQIAEIPVLLLVCAVLSLSDAPATLSAICYIIYALQFAAIGITARIYKTDYPSCGSNMVLAGMTLATAFSLWWACMTLQDPGFIEESAHPGSFEIKLYFLIYTLTLLNSNGFILMTKERVQAELERNQHEDDLTGLDRALWLREAAEKSLARLRQIALPATLLLIDIDHFRDINSQYGSNNGNRILQQLSLILQEKCTPDSDIYRMKDSSFAILIAAQSIYQVMDRAEEILATVSDTIFLNDCRITVSCGISVAATTDNWPAWLARARHALKQAKAHGRNKIQADNLEFTTRDLPKGIRRAGQLLWLPEYSTGHTEIDAQHRALFERTNVMLQLWARTTDKQTITKAVTGFLALSEAHFTFETQVLNQYQHTPTDRNIIDRHTTSHEAILQRANQLLSRYQENDLTGNALFSFLIFEFVCAHIRDNDMEISRFLCCTDTK